MTALVVFAHGSSVAAANEAVQRVTEELKARREFGAVIAAFLELAEPDLPEAIRRAVDLGATRVVVVPYFLTPGVHLTRDLPRIAGELRDIYPTVRIDVTESLDRHPALLEAVLDRAKQTYGGSGPEGQAD